MRVWLRKLDLWEPEARANLPPEIVGKRVHEALSGKAAVLVQHLTPAEITSDKGYELIRQAIADGYKYLVEEKLEKVFDDAIYRSRRDRGASVTD